MAMMRFLIVIFVFAWSGSISALPPATKLVNQLNLKVVRKDETVVFFPTCSHEEDLHNEGDHWVVPIHGWIFDDERRGLRRRAFLALLRSALRNRGSENHGTLNEDPLSEDEDMDDEEQILLQEEEETDDDSATTDPSSAKQVLARRLLPFIVDNHRRRKITVRFGSVERELPERSRKNGHFFANLRLTKDELAGATYNSDDTICFEAVTGIDDDPRSFQGSSILVPQKGLSVISDIDDTVKISHVLDKKRLIRHTFLEEFQAVPGMAQLYQSWKQDHGAVFHFVSSSPWQLYQEISSFLAKEGFPSPASFHLKSVRLKDRTLLNLFVDPMESKLAKISSIIDTWPQRRFVLVGDTGERDPEVYGEICRRYPNSVDRVFLRDVTRHLSDEIVQELNKKHQKKKSGVVINGPDRFTKAFRDVPPETWSLFTESSTIEL